MTCCNAGLEVFDYSFHFTFSDLSLLQTMLSSLLLLYFLNKNMKMIQLSLFMF